MLRLEASENDEAARYWNQEGNTMQQTCLELYFMEQDRKKRLEFLEEADRQGDCKKEVVLCKKIWERRYADRVKEPKEVDYFIRALMIIGSYSKGTISRMLSVPKKIKENILYNLFLEDIAAYEEEDRKILYQEYCNCARLYYGICRESRSYGSKAFGLVGMSDKELSEKIGKEIKAFLNSAIPTLKMEKELELFGAAFKEEYIKIYPDKRNMFES